MCFREGGDKTDTPGVDIPPEDDVSSGRDEKKRFKAESG